MNNSDSTRHFRSSLCDTIPALLRITPKEIRSLFLTRRITLQQVLNPVSGAAILRSDNRFSPALHPPPSLIYTNTIQLARVYDNLSPTYSAQSISD